MCMALTHGSSPRSMTQRSPPRRTSSSSGLQPDSPVSHVELEGRSKEAARAAHYSPSHGRPGTAADSTDATADPGHIFDQHKLQKSSRAGDSKLRKKDDEPGSGVTSKSGSGAQLYNAADSSRDRVLVTSAAALAGSEYGRYRNPDRGSGSFQQDSAASGQNSKHAGSSSSHIAPNLQQSQSSSLSKQGIRSLADDNVPAEMSAHTSSASIGRHNGYSTRIAASATQHGRPPLSNAVMESLPGVQHMAEESASSPKVPHQAANARAAAGPAALQVARPDSADETGAQRAAALNEMYHAMRGKKGELCCSGRYEQTWRILSQ